MFLAKRFLSRRAMLRGGGAAIALPFLDSMVPAQTPLARTAASPRSRLVCIEMVHGAAGSATGAENTHYWSPENEGAGFRFSSSLEPLAPFRDYVTVVSNTDLRQAEALAPSEVGADHFRSSAVFLTGVHPKQTARLDVLGGTSVDQIYASHLGRSTPLPSIQLRIENVNATGSCAFNYSCVYSSAISWAAPTQPLPMMMNPRLVFEKLFGDRAIATQSSRAQPLKGSILDGVTPAAAGLGAGFGPADRRVLEKYLGAIRDVERRIEATETRNAAAVNRYRLTAPLGVPDSWEEHVNLMFDLQVLALSAEVTRVSAFKMSHDTNNRSFPESGVSAPFHSLSHHGGQAAAIADFAKINRYHVGVVAGFLRKLKDTADGDGNLLDHSLIVYGSPMGDSNTHNHRRVPLFLAGHASGAIRGGLHYRAKEGTPQTNALLTVLNRLGVPQERVGDSTGQLAI